MDVANNICPQYRGIKNTNFTYERYMGLKLLTWWYWTTLIILSAHLAYLGKLAVLSLDIHIFWQTGHFIIHLMVSTGLDDRWSLVSVGLGDRWSLISVALGDCWSLVSVALGDSWSAIIAASCHGRWMVRFFLYYWRLPLPHRRAVTWRPMVYGLASVRRPAQRLAGGWS